MAKPDSNVGSPDNLGIMLIHGVGLIGGSLGLAAKKAGLVTEVYGVGRDLSRLAHAIHLGAIDRSFLDQGDGLARAAAKADIIVLATPVPNIIRDLPIVLATAKPTAVITDVGSVKAPIVQAAGDDPRFIGSHPMAGSEQHGVDAANPNLFQGATWALTPTTEKTTDAYLAVKRLAESVGAFTRTLSPSDHDNAVAVTSHLPHVLAYVLMTQAAEAARNNPELPHLSAGSFASATRVAGSQATLWQGISMENRVALSKAIADYRGRLGDAQQALDNGDDKAILQLFQHGHDARLNWSGK